MMHIAKSTHFYDHDGNPVYEVPYADPSRGMRKTHLGDARKLLLVPGVSTICNIPEKPALNYWKQGQVLTAAYNCPVENEKDWRTSVLDIANIVSKESSEIGTEIHAAIERYYRAETLALEDAQYHDHVQNVVNVLSKYYPAGWVPERSFAHPLGFGGKADLSFQSEECQKGIVVDFKSKDFDEDTPVKKLAYPEMAMQLDAYRHGLGMPEALMVSLFVDRKTGIVKSHEWPTDGNYFEQFKCLLRYWQLSSNYNSGWEEYK